MNKETIFNRYGDKYSFQKIGNNIIKWEGPFVNVRFGYPNDYTKAYNAYTADQVGTGEHVLSKEEFEVKVHEYDYEKNTRSELNKMYGYMVHPKKDVINMVDPSGGPHLSEGTSLLGKTIKSFIFQEDGTVDIICE